MKLIVRRSNVDSVDKIEVLMIKSIVGHGDCDEDVVRQIIEYWDFDGNLLARRDPFIEQDGKNPNGYAVIDKELKNA